MIKVLIIGANSYIGKSFVHYINKRYQTNQIKKQYFSNRYDDIEIETVSASNGEWRYIDFVGYDSILLLSGIVHIKEKKGMESLYMNVNCKLPIEIAKRAKSARVGQFVFMSTAAVYGSKLVCINKDTVPEPETLYGKSKFKAEEGLNKIADDNFRLAIIRPPMIYGEGCKGNYTRLEKIAKYLPFFPDYHNMRSMLYVETLCEVIYSIIMEQKEGIYLPHDNDYADTVNIVKQIRYDLGKRTICVKGFNWLIRILIKRVGVVRKMFGDWYYERE